MNGRHTVESSNQRQCILVVEDHEDTADMLVMVLQDEGYRVHRLCDAGSAQGMLTDSCPAKESCPDLVLLDLTMPGLDPVEMVKQMAPGIMPPVMVLSAKPRQIVEAAAREIGALAIVNKPFAIEDLIGKVKSVLASTPVER